MIQILLLTLLLSNVNPTQQQNVRYDVGTYYNYLVLETTDGNEWLLEETDEEKQGIEKVPYVEGDKFLLTFDTMGTESKLDDIILSMKYID